MVSIKDCWPGDIILLPRAHTNAYEIAASFERLVDEDWFLIPVLIVWY